MLDKIVQAKKKEIAGLNVGEPGPSERDFRAALRGKHNLIAEIKFRSPSEGDICKGYAKVIAATYDRYANAISVLTDKTFFGGDKNNIMLAKEGSTLPVLRKDFLVHEKQVIESRELGADAILLIASILTDDQIARYSELAARYKMECLLEVHDEEELLRALKFDCIIGINNRDLKIMKTDLSVTARLKNLAPSDRIIVSESGIDSLNDIENLDTNAVLVGTSLMKSDDPASKLRSMRKPKVKICGITDAEDAVSSAKAGADILGFNFCRDSPRYIEPEKAKGIIARLPKTVATAGIFVDQDIERAQNIVTLTGVDYVQLHGDESPKYCSAFRRPVIKAFRIKDQAPDTSRYKVFAKLFDSFSMKMHGGTGKAFDHDLISSEKGKLFLSGGLDPDNLGNIDIDPYCFDVCSGVEKDKGIKDIDKVKRFIRRVKG